MSDITKKEETNAVQDKKKSKNRILIKHIRKVKKDKKGNALRHANGNIIQGRYIATLVAVPSVEDNKTVIIAWSKCHRKDREKNRLSKISDKERGYRIAMARAENGGSKLDIPFTLQKEITRFIVRAQMYYSNKSVIVPRGVSIHEVNEMVEERKQLK